MRLAVVGGLEKVMLPSINTIRAEVNVGPVASVDEFLRRSPLLLVASGKPFQYPQTDWGDAVQMIGPCVLDPEPNSSPDWLATIEKPIVLVTTSSEKQADANLVQTAITALADEPVQVVATVPAGQDDVTASPNATVRRFVPHGVVLDQAVCAVTHGGMGVTQKALAHGVPVCVVPYGRDQFEVARRVERAALLAHDEVLRSSIEAQEGWLFKHTGDGVCAAFASPKSAVDAAVAAQRALELPVRMGLATGEAEQLQQQLLAGGAGGASVAVWASGLWVVRRCLTTVSLGSPPARMVSMLPGAQASLFSSMA